MLETLRNAAKTWVAAIFIGLLVLSFAIWGVNDIFRGGQATTLAKVGDAELHVRTFENEYARRVQRELTAKGQPMTAAEGRAVGYDRRVLDDMVSDLAVLEEAKRVGLTASDDMVRSVLYGMPGLVAPDGSVDRNVFGRFLQSIGYSEDEFYAAIRYDIMRSQLLQAAALGPPVPRGFGLTLQAFANERRTIEYMVLPAEKAGEIAAPDDATLQAYVDANAAAYTAPEMRGITLLSVGPKDVLPSIDIGEDAIKAAYDSQKHRFETLESRELQQIVYPTKEEADAAYATLSQGKTFEDLAAERKLKVEDMALGTISKGDTTVPAGAFEVAEGQVSAPLEGPFGWALIKVLKVNPGSTKTYESVRQELRDELAMEQALDQITTLVDKMTDEMAATDSLEEAAKGLNLTLRTIPAVDAQGLDAEGKPIADLPDGEGFLQEVFQLDQGERGDVAETEGHVLYVARVDSIAPSAVRPLATIRDKASAAWIAAEQAKKLKGLAEDSASRANGAGTAAEDVAKELGVELKSSEPLARDATSPDLSPDLIAALFGTKSGTYVAGAGAALPSYVVARVKEASAVEPADAAADERQVRTAESQGLGDDLREVYRQEIVKTIPVTIDEKLFEQTRQRGS